MFASGSGLARPRFPLPGTTCIRSKAKRPSPNAPVPSSLGPACVVDAQNHLSFHRTTDCEARAQILTVRRLLRESTRQPKRGHPSSVLRGSADLQRAPVPQQSPSPVRLASRLARYPLVVQQSRKTGNGGKDRGGSCSRHAVEQGKDDHGRHRHGSSDQLDSKQQARIPGRLEDEDRPSPTIEIIVARTVKSAAGQYLANAGPYTNRRSVAPKAITTTPTSATLAKPAAVTMNATFRRPVNPRSSTRGSPPEGRCCLPPG